MCQQLLKEVKVLKDVASSNTAPRVFYLQGSVFLFSRIYFSMLDIFQYCYAYLSVLVIVVNHISKNGTNSSYCITAMKS